MNREAVLDRVNAVRATLLDGNMDAVVADTGGMGLCEYAAEELAEALADLDVWVTFAESRWNGWYNGELSGPHWVAVVEGWVVDLTARQWDETLPYPLVFPYTDA